MSSSVLPEVAGSPPARAATWVWALGLALLAFAVRLETVLRGGGLFGRIGYDGSVYYAAAAALAHGLLPYRDFLLLYPPGIVPALLPFAGLGRLLGDANGFAAARLAWFGLGATSTALVFAVFRPRGLLPAVAAAGCYAVFVPAVVSEHTTSLEAVGSVCLLGALALLRPAGAPQRAAAPLVAAEALLGVATGTKIWGAAVVLAVVAWSVARVGPRRAGLVLAGAVGGATVVCLPFFLAAPGAMWRMVVSDQLGRPRVDGGLAGRLVDLAGFSELRGITSTKALAAAAAVLLAVLVVLALRDPLGRLACVLLAVTGAVLLLSPPWSVAYTGLAAPAVVLLVGSGVARLARRSVRGRPVVVAVVVAGLLAYGAASLPGLTFGSRFPGRSLDRVLAARPGCVTTDDPVLLIETGALGRNLDRRCPVVVDPGGYSYDLRPGADHHTGRAENAQWQDFLRSHLAAGSTAVVVRFRRQPGLSSRTRATIARWPVLADVGGYLVRTPPSSGHGSTG
ncbi:hypothetical protein SAMN04488544_0651 [Microlunatus sagamiharensis]|uniref:Dolichyl-phosphate-mannose-protein mannosyltransferase n=1 Tax=Microlunatus sagamiharensis TaxID=546874 RepID=A0A1H2LQW9_9ACTN|nr:hypothetical protein [Microlunatus sagamiharensis]SDU83232.1 hypothetical protein SAMN04488544_0651 [Microlunatus sagamiharensis]